MAYHHHVQPESPVSTKRRNPFGETSPIFIKQGRVEEVDMNSVYGTLAIAVSRRERPTGSNGSAGPCRAQIQNGQRS